MKHVIIATPDELKDLERLAEYVLEEDTKGNIFMLAQTLARLIKQASLK